MNMYKDQDFQALESYLLRIPSVKGPISHDNLDDGNWTVQFSINVTHTLAWHTVQELGCVLNYLSVTERLPTVFFPVSPAPYLNGGPYDFLSWIIESKSPEFAPATCAEWLEGRLPRPVEDVAQWPEEL